MDESFEKYIIEARAKFVNYINSQIWDMNLRTEAEDLLIAYDQMKEKLATRKE